MREKGKKIVCSFDSGNHFFGSIARRDDANVHIKGNRLFLALQEAYHIIARYLIKGSCGRISETENGVGRYLDRHR